jgi:KDO2-lipid IV(A) lauroyltransferase
MGFWGWAAHVFLGKPRERIDENLRLIFPQWDRATRRRFGRRVLIHLGWNVLDFLRMDRLTPQGVKRLVRCEGFPAFDAAFRRGRGVVAVTGHVGNWELLAAYFASRGYPVSVVARSLQEPRWDRWIRGLRERLGVRVLDRDRDGLQMIRVLRKGEILGILLDQATQVESVQVPFMGRDARTPVGPARLAQKTGAALVPMVIQMDGEWRHCVTVGQEIEVPDGGSDSVLAATARCNEVLENLIMTHPEQWVWFHERWR